MDNCIGLDISKSTINVHIPKGSLDLEIENSSKAIKGLYGKLGKIYKKEITTVIFIYEPTGGYSQLLTQFCANKAIRVFMINPKNSHNYAKAIGQRGKSDKVDAKMLSSCIGIAKKSDIKIPVINPIEQELKDLMGYYKFTTKQRVQTTNHLESVAIKDGSTYARQELQKEIKHLLLKEKAIIEKIKDLLQKDVVLNTKFNNIKSIVGIGDVGAIALIHLFVKYPDANQRQIISLTGLDPIERSSGSSIKGKSRISKAGSKLYRGSLFMSAMVAIRYNDAIKVFYDRLKENGKHTTVAQVAVVKKLIIIAHSLYKNSCDYDVELHEKHSGKNTEMVLCA
jgi:transposase